MAHETWGIFAVERRQGLTWRRLPRARRVKIHSALPLALKGLAVALGNHPQ